MWGGLLGLLAAMFGRRKPSITIGPTTELPEVPGEPTPLTTDGVPPEPIYVGKRGDPELEALLSEMDDYFRSGGVDSTITAAEVTFLPKDGKYAIPPRSHWPRMRFTLYELWNPIRREMDEPLLARAFRPLGYNERVGGASYIPGRKRGSSHLYFEAIDLRPQNTKSRRKLAMVAANVYVSKGGRIKMGFGAYGKPTPSNVHVDAGYSQRTWRDAQYYISEHKKIA